MILYFQVFSKQTNVCLRAVFTNVDPGSTSFGWSKLQSKSV